jgi:hypothetical protein
MIDESRIGKDFEGNGRGHLEILSGIYSERLSKTMKDAIQDSWYPNQDLNQAPLEYKPRGLSLRPPARSIYREGSKRRNVPTMKICIQSWGSTFAICGVKCGTRVFLSVDPTSVYPESQNFTNNPHSFIAQNK